MLLKKKVYKGKKVKALIVYISDISGHRQAAKAVKEALNKNYPWITVREENLFRHGNSFVRCSLDSLYYTLIKLTPWFWDLIWDSKGIYWLTYPVRSILYRLNYHRIYRRIIKPFDPNIVVCTHSLSCAVCSAIKKDKNMDYLLAAVPTDFYLNPYWFYQNVDIYFLPHGNSELESMEQKIPSRKLQVSGIPISPEFSKPKDEDYLREKWQVEQGLFTVLIMGGGQGLGAIDEVVLALEENPLPLQVLVVTGTNRELKKNLYKLKSQLSFPLKVLGYVKEIDELMEISDVLITKPGGLTTAEALSKGIPIVVIDSITGQERRNKDLLLKKGLAFKLDSMRDIVPVINEFVNNGFNRNLWKQKVSTLARPCSSEDIAHRIADMMQDKRRTNE